MVLLLYVMVARSIFVMWEQPRGSTMEYHPRFQAFLKLKMLYRHHAKLWDFGGESEKGLWLYSQYPWIAEISNFCVVPDIRGPIASGSFTQSSID